MINHQPFMKVIAKGVKTLFRPTIVCFISAILWVIAFPYYNAMAEIYGQYKGWQACKECHTEISDGWSKTRHARAFESLVGSNQKDLPECVKCHVVGYGESGGFLDPDLTTELSGVQCESCHGPGAKHLEMPEDPDFIVRAPGKDLCRTCHTAGQDPNFDYQKKIVSVHGTESLHVNSQSIPQTSRPSGSKLYADKTLIEYPSVDEGTPVIANVVLKNIGDSDIRITDLFSS